jgi:hypothetical protein
VKVLDSLEEGWSERVSTSLHKSFKQDRRTYGVAVVLSRPDRTGLSLDRIWLEVVVDESVLRGVLDKIQHESRSDRAHQLRTRADQHRIDEPIGRSTDRLLP